MTKQEIDPEAFGRPSRTITVPAIWGDDGEGTLHVHSENGRSAAMHLVTDQGETVAAAEGFERPDGSSSTWLDCDERELFGVFGNFLSAVLESSQPEVAEGWLIPNRYLAQHWVDALAVAVDD